MSLKFFVDDATKVPSQLTHQAESSNNNEKYKYEKFITFTLLAQQSGLAKTVFPITASISLTLGVLLFFTPKQSTYQFSNYDS